ncbi:chemotaxis protein CheR [Pusillimonas sp. CC-YST705]|uniref:Chemotaxis protein methyltransferase n=1 Tax=Mesopusillimonas faecipullorum TaxID=2755040 RepID=A0ABS8C9Y2_9BURK|nr:CheR family methyltransferase [Mesopusillimonas faecipullorum]MCB5362803.1 chemotaxis protein CheR [Mesopusillimonas faecipullorum]
MTASGSRLFSAPATQLPMSSEDFAQAARLLSDRTGIVLGDHKEEMTARVLDAQARKSGQGSVAAYLAYLRQHPQAEIWQSFINAFTVNHTAFFRERHHFEILADFAKQRPAPISVWCCAASTGEEAYTIAMTLLEVCGRAPSRVSVLATDIDSKAIQKAQRGVYTAERVKAIPENLLRQYFQRGRGSNEGLVRVKPVLGECIRFQTLNLVEPAWPIDQKFDAIFCRNTMIYFDKKTQVRILERFVPLLKKDGLLFAGHSENFTYLTQVFRLQGQTVYRVVS